MSFLKASVTITDQVSWEVFVNLEIEKDVSKKLTIHFQNLYVQKNQSLAIMWVNLRRLA